MSSNNNKPLTKLSCEELVALLKQENVTQKVTNFLAESDVTGLDFSESNFIDETILCEETKAVLKLLPSQVSALRKVHARLCASESEPTTTTNAAASSSAEPPHQTPPASPVTQEPQQSPSAETASPLIDTQQNASSSNELNATTSQQHSPSASSLSPIEIDPDKPITELSCAELVEVLRQKKIKESILNYLKKHEVQGPDFAHPDFVEKEILTEKVKSQLDLLDSQIATLRDVHRRLCSNSAEPSSPIAENTSPTSSPRSLFQHHQDPNSPTSPLSTPNPSTLELLKVEVDKFPQLDDATAEKLQTAVGVLGSLKQQKGYVGSFFTIIHGVVSGIHNANGGAKKDCLKLIAKVSRIVAGPNASFLFNPPRDYVPLFKEVIALAKEAKLLIAKFIPLTKEDETFLSNVKQAAALFGAYEKDFDLIDKKINNIHIEISSAMGLSTNQILRYGPSGKIDLRAQARDISDMNTFINKIKESCRTWYNDALELEVASSSPTKQIVKLENLFVDLKIQRQVNASSIAENAAGEYADTSNLQKHLFQSSSSSDKSATTQGDGQPQQQIKLLTLIEGPAGCGKTTCCQEFTRLQQIDGAFVIFIALKELFDCGQMTSIDDILSFVRAPPAIRECLPEILKYNIPIVWILDGFDEVMLTDDGGVRFFLKNFVDPTTRKKNIENKVLPDFARPCDAVIISSRENRVDNKDVVVLNNLDSSLAPDRWVIQRWRRDAISRYVLKHFEKAGKPLSDGELTAIVDKTLSPQMQGFHGIPLFIKLICDSKLEDPTFDVSKISPPFLYQKNLRQAFDRAKVRISYLLNQDASWMKYENDRDKLFNDIVLPNASKRALTEFLNHEGTALTFKVPQNDALPLWLSVMLEMGLLQRDKQSDNSFKFPHRTFIEFLAAKHVSLHAAEAMPQVPFKDELNTTWLLMCQLANQRETEGFFSKLITTGLTSKQLAKFVAKQFVEKYRESSHEDRQTHNEAVITSFVNKLSLRLLLQVAVALPDDLLMDEVKSAHGAVVLNAPSHLKWMIEWCGVFGAIKVLKWIDKKFPHVVDPAKPPNDIDEQTRIRARCHRGLARALQSRGANASSLVEECVSFYVDRAGELEIEDAIAADSHFVLQDALRKKKWNGSTDDFFKLLRSCIKKRKSHPNLLASLLVYLRSDELESSVMANNRRMFLTLQSCWLLAPEKIEIRNDDKDKSVIIANFSDELRKSQVWTQKPLFDDARTGLISFLEDDDDLAEVFKHPLEFTDDDNDNAPATSSEEFLRTGFRRLVYEYSIGDRILREITRVSPLQSISLKTADKLTDKSFEIISALSSLQTLNLTHAKLITDDGLQHLAKLSSLQTLNLYECDKITDVGLEHLAKLPCLQTLNLPHAKLITDDGLQHLAKLSSLQSLNLRECDSFTESGLQHLAKLPPLQTLNLTVSDSITDSGLEQLAKLSSLQTLNLPHAKLITDDSLRYLATLSSLQTLNLYECDKITDVGLQHLSKLPSLKTLNLTVCDKITDSGLEHLAKLPCLQTLNLPHAKLITDDGLQHLAKLSSLQTLDLQCCSKITDVGLQHLSKLPSLKTLNLTVCDTITDVGLEHLAKLPCLQTLNLPHAKLITDDGLQHLAKLSSLQSLNLHECDKITDNGLQLLAKLPSLHTLNITASDNITDSGLEQLAKLSSLQTLNLTVSDNITDSGLEQLAKLSSLQALNLPHAKLITDDGLQHLANLPSLQTLHLPQAKLITRKGIQHLIPKLTLLESLVLAESQIDYTSFRDLSHLQSLNLAGSKRFCSCFASPSSLLHLDLTDCTKLDNNFSIRFVGRDNSEISSIQTINLSNCNKITDDVIERLVKNRSTLQSINLCNCVKLTDESLDHLSSSTASLQHLNLQGCENISNDGIVKLSTFTALKSLNLQDCIKITERSLHIFETLPSLHALNLGGCKHITDLEHLLTPSMSALRSLSLSGCTKISDVDIERVANTLLTLESLDLSFCDQLTNEGILQLSKLASLQTLKLRSCSTITDEGFKMLSKLPSLQRLQLHDCGKITDDTLQSLSQSSSLSILEELKVGPCDITDSALEIISNMSSLQILHLNCSGSGKAITNDAISSMLSKLPLLQTIELAASSGANVTGDGLVMLSTNCPSLKQLDVFNLKRFSFKSVSELSSLRTLNLVECSLDNDSLAHLAKLSSLTSLDLSNSDICDDGLSHLSQLSSLTTLSLAGCHDVTKDGLRHLSKLSFLENLELHDSAPISDEVLQHLSNLPFLRSLDLGHCKEITDTGLQHLSKLTRLEKLIIIGCPQVTDNGVQQLIGVRNHFGEESSDSDGEDFFLNAPVLLCHLRTLTISDCRQLTDKTVGHLRDLVDLQELDLSSCPELTDHCFYGLGDLVSLRTFKVSSRANGTLSNTLPFGNLTSLQQLPVPIDSLEISDDGLTNLSDLTSLKSLDLQNCSDISDDGIAHLSTLLSLETLNLGSCSKLTDRALQQLPLAKMTCLETLILSSLTLITDAGLQLVAECPSLHTLNLDNCSKITDGGIDALTRRKSSRLKHLSLANCVNITDRSVETMSIRLSSLESLNLTDCQITDCGAEHLADLKLQALTLRGCNAISDNGLLSISNVRSLKLLDIGNCHLVSNDSVDHIAKLPHLETLDLERCKKITDDGIQRLSSELQSTSLHTLNLGNLENISDRSLECLATASLSLKKLDVSSCNKITDAGLKQLENMSSLEALNFVSCSQITDEGLKSLQKFQLKSLNLSSCLNIGESGLSSLQIYLENLSLSNSSVTDKGLHYLQQMSNLKRLDLSNCKGITDTGVVMLFKKLVETLEFLNLGATNITNASLVGIVSAATRNTSSMGKLESETHLRSLDVRKCEGITEERVEESRRALGFYKIDLIA